MTKLNIHELLSDWHTEPNYPKIIKFAVSKKLNNPETILNIIKKKYPIKTKIGMRNIPVPINVFGTIQYDKNNIDNTYLIERESLNQLEKASKIPVAISSAGMPDMHVGYSLPIGGVIELEKAISPAFVGYDISCMMYLTILNISVEDFEKSREMFFKHLIDSTNFGVGGKIKEKKIFPLMDFSNWKLPFLRDFKDLAYSQVGTFGGGNHFANIMAGKFKQDFENINMWKEGDEFVALLTHSGSRGAGYKFASKYIKLAEEFTKNKYVGIPKNYGWLETDTDIGMEYLVGMNMFSNWAEDNHRYIHGKFLKLSGLDTIDTVYNFHNLAWDLYNTGNYIHRKGATPAHNFSYGIIPGTCGTKSLIVKGLGNEDSLNSASHGAGRNFSRTEAKKRFNKKEFDMSMGDILYRGINTDESPKAYKSIDDVMRFQENILVETVANMYPRIVIMGGDKKRMRTRR